MAVTMSATFAQGKSASEPGSRRWSISHRLPVAADQKTGRGAPVHVERTASGGAPARQASSSLVDMARKS